MIGKDEVFVQINEPVGGARDVQPTRTASLQ